MRRRSANERTAMSTSSACSQCSPEYYVVPPLARSNVFWKRKSVARSGMVPAAAILCGLFMAASAAGGGSGRDRLQPEQLEYLGAFRLPDTDPKLASRFPYGGHALAFNPAGDKGNGSLFVAGHAHHQLVAEVTIPTPARDREINKLGTAELLQPFGDVTGGLRGSLPGKDMRLGGLLVYKGRLLWSIYRWYNVEGETLPSHGVSDLDLSRPNAAGLWKIGTHHSQKTAGFMMEVPEQWRKHLQFPVLTGQSLMQGRASSSEGPAAFGFDLWSKSQLPKSGAAISSRQFLSYDVKHPAAYQVAGASHKWKGANRVSGAAFSVSADGKRSAVIFFVRVGLHPTDWYGEPSQVPGGAKACDGGRGYHAPPYKAMAWFYDPADFVRVASGRAQSWSIKPYAMKDVSVDLYSECATLSAVSYDPASRRVYVIEPGVDQKNPFESWPLVHVYVVQ